MSNVTRHTTPNPPVVIESRTSSVRTSPVTSAVTAPSTMKIRMRMLNASMLPLRTAPTISLRSGQMPEIRYAANSPTPAARRPKYVTSGRTTSMITIGARLLTHAGA